MRKKKTLVFPKVSNVNIEIEGKKGQEFIIIMMEAKVNYETLRKKASLTEPFAGYAGERGNDNKIVSDLHTELSACMCREKNPLNPPLVFYNVDQVDGRVTFNLIDAARLHAVELYMAGPRASCVRTFTLMELQRADNDEQLFDAKSSPSLFVTLPSLLNIMTTLVKRIDKGPKDDNFALFFARDKIALVFPDELHEIVTQTLGRERGSLGTGYFLPDLVPHVSKLEVPAGQMRTVFYKTKTRKDSALLILSFRENTNQKQIAKSTIVGKKRRSTPSILDLTVSGRLPKPIHNDVAIDIRTLYKDGSQDVFTVSAADVGEEKGNWTGRESCLWSHLLFDLLNSLHFTKIELLITQLNSIIVRLSDERRDGFYRLYMSNMNTDDYSHLFPK